MWRDRGKKLLILAFLKKRVQTARTAYLSSAEEGFQQGRRKELVGDGLIRSQGGWPEVKRLRSQVQGKQSHLFLGCPKTGDVVS